MSEVYVNVHCPAGIPVVPKSGDLLNTLTETQSNLEYALLEDSQDFLEDFEITSSTTRSHCVGPYLCLLSVDFPERIGWISYLVPDQHLHHRICHLRSGP